MLPGQLIGFSSKSYFSLANARDWAQVVRPHIEADGGEGVFLCPSFPLIPLFLHAFADTSAQVGAQDVSRYPQGAYTGEVAAGILAELGVVYAMIGHPERRALLEETSEVMSAKVAQAVTAGLVPIVILGENSAAEAPGPVLDRQLKAVFERVEEAGVECVLAYEPTWAIGAARPADPDHIVAVVATLRQLASRHTDAFRIIYGGSAAPGTYTAIAAAGRGSPGMPDGIFLGRAGLDPHGFINTLEEVRQGADTSRLNSQSLTRRNGRTS